MNRMETESLPSVVEPSEEARELLERIKSASNGPEHAKRRIEELDKMVKNLKSRRRVCGEAMEKDRENMVEIDNELERLNKQYKPLCTRLEDRERTMENVKRNLELAERTMVNIMGQTKATKVSGMLSNAHMKKKEASAHIKKTRGFGVEPETTFYQSRRIMNKK